jgi:glycosidase
MPTPSRPRARLLSLALTAGLTAAAAAAEPPAVPAGAVDWRDQVVYLVMIDRFADGDPTNNDQGQGEYDPADPRKFSGGDLAGLRQRLDYIRGLGASAIWITPPVANRWWSDAAQFGGYHGYWTKDFMAVDAHFGSLDDYRGLAAAMRARDLRLIQDVVVNHVADYHGWRGAHDPADPARNFELRPEADGSTAPLRPPFDRNDARRPEHRRAGIYHWNPQIRDHADPLQQQTWQLADLDDLNTSNPEVMRALRESYGYWIREVGVDAFRVDTAFHVAPEFFEDFVHADDPQHPGMMRAAPAGQAPFFLFGEGFGVDRPYEDTMARKIETYVRGPAGQPRLPSMINFPLYGTLGDVFARRHPTGELGHRIESMMRVHADPWRMPTFIDNHDVDRFLAGSDEAGLRQALLALMTLPGIPTIYYGTEQGFREQRAAMFAGGHGAGGRDRFDTDAPLYRYLAEVAALRREHRVFSRGTPTVLAANAAAPGAIAWKMRYEGVEALVVFNTADHPTLLDNLDTGLPAGTVLRPLYGLAAAPETLRVIAGRPLHLTLPPRSAMLWTTAGTAADSPPGAGSPITLDPAPASTTGDLALSGRAPGRQTVQVVVDGDLAAARTVPVDRDGRWRATVATDDMIEPGIEHRAVIWDTHSQQASAAHAFRVDRAWTRVAAIDDPAGDDTGPDGRYVYPLDDGWRKHRPGDLRGAEVWRSGDALRLRIRLPTLVQEWNPLLGFDHVAFTVFIELPGRPGGATVLPQQNATLPDGMRWHLRLRAHGWSNTLFTAEGTSATHEGTAAGQAARLDVDGDTHTLAWTLPARALGGAGLEGDALAGARIHVTTWDYDGGFRALAPEAGATTFGGGPADGAKVMDALTVRLPR